MSGKAVSCRLCKLQKESRFRCARFEGTVLCRQCCIEQMDGHHCVWWLSLIHI